MLTETGSSSTSQGTILRSLLAAGAVALGLLTASPAAAQVKFAVEVFTGVAININTPLKLEQGGQPDIEFTADYETRPFEQPFYWAIRVGLRSPKSAWELQLFHHKLYLVNPPPDVQYFDITHGYNILTLNYARELQPVTVRAGAGVVVPHVSATVRDQDFSKEEGYGVAGPAFLAGAGKRWPIVAGLSIAAETQFIVSWIDKQVAGGRVSASSVALHVWIGLGYAF